ncbi:MAG: hypothetical protein HQK57_01720 [Deltaproteobacteria bacterium]|nr:hypothetical protein [Deltaproteobacteria bacterium]
MPESFEYPKRYRAFGINISSSMSCPQFLPGSGPPHVFFRYGDVPLSLSNALETSPTRQVTKERVLFFSEDIGRYLVSEGREILIHRDQNAESAVLRVRLLGSPLGGLLHQRKMFPLHGNAMVQNDTGLIILGDKGSGKTTLAAALFMRGWHIMADDICVVTFQDQGLPFVHPGAIHLKIRETTAHMIGASIADLIPVPGIQDRKFWLAPENHICRHKARLALILVLATETRPDYSITPITRMDTLDQLYRHTYRRRLINYFGNRLDFLCFANAMASKVPAFMISLTQDGFLFERIADDILRYVQNTPARTPVPMIRTAATVPPVEMINLGEET